MSVKKWCEERRIDRKAYYRWEKEILAKASQQLAVREQMDIPAFVEVREGPRPERIREGTVALTGLEYCNKLFAWEERFKKFSPEERKRQRLKEEKPILDALLAWANSVSAAPKSALGKALHYLREQWPYLRRMGGWS